MPNPLKILHIKKGHLEGPGWPIRSDMITKHLPLPELMRSVVPLVMSDTELRFAMDMKNPGRPALEERQKIQSYINTTVRIRLDPDFYEEEFDMLEKTVRAGTSAGRVQDVEELHRTMIEDSRKETLRFCQWGLRHILEANDSLGYDGRPLIYLNHDLEGWVETHVETPIPSNQPFKVLASAEARIERALSDYAKEYQFDQTEIEGRNGVPSNV